ncbi:MAG TPA: hypothetical protein VGH28_00380 [Polyangiaceae bacterium]|jgi:hypothetical protein
MHEDRELAADVVHLVGNIDGFAGFYWLENRTEFDAAVLIAIDRGRVVASARLTVLPHARVLIVSSMSAIGHSDAIVLTADELAAAAKRDDTRRAAWTDFRLDVDSRVETRWDARKLLLVSASPAIDATVLRAAAAMPLTTYGMRDPARVLDALAIFPMPTVIVLDAELPGAVELERTIRATYPARFGAFDRIQYVSSARGLRPEDTERILGALGMRLRPTAAKSPLEGVSILVVDEPDGTLDEEVFAVASGASVQIATGWEAIEHLDAGRFDLVIAGEPADLKLSLCVGDLLRAVER